MSVAQEFLKGHNLAGALGGAGEHNVQLLIENNFGAPNQFSGCDVGMKRNPNLASTGEDVDSSVVIVINERPVGGRRLAELLDFLPKRGNVIPSLAEGERQLLVLIDRLRQLTFGFEKALFKSANSFGSVLESTAERGHFLFKHTELLPEFTIRRVVATIRILGTHRTDLLLVRGTLSALSVR